MEVGNLSVKIDFDLSDLRQGLKEIGITASLAAQTISKSFSDVGASLSENLTVPVVDAAQKLVDAFDDAQTAMGEGLATAAETAAQRLGVAFSGVKGSVNSKVTVPMTNAAKKIGDSFSKAGKNLSSSLITASNKARTTVVKMASDIVKAMDKVDRALDKGSDSSKSLAASAQTSFSKTTSSLLSFASGSTDAIIKINNLRRAWEEIGSALGPATAKLATYISTKATDIVISGNSAAASALVALGFTATGYAAGAATPSVLTLAAATALVAAPMIAIVATVGLAVAAFLKLTKDSRQLNKEIKDLSKTLQDARDSATQQTEAVATNTETVKKQINNLFSLISTYGSLKRIGMDTTETLSDIGASILEINTAIPDANLAFNTITESLSMEEEALRSLYNSWSSSEIITNALENQRRAANDETTIVAKMITLLDESGKIAEGNTDKYNLLTTELGEAHKEYELYTNIVKNNINTMKDYNGTILDTIDLKKLESKAIERLLENQELSLQDHYDEIARLETSAEADREEQIIEHYEKIQELQQEAQEQLEQARQEHVDRMLGFDRKGAYGRGKSFQQQLNAAKEYENDMILWQANLEKLTNDGFGELAEIYRSGGVEMGGELDNVVKELQDKGPAGIKDFNDLMTGAASGAYDETIAEYDKVPDAVSEVIGDESGDGSETAMVAYDLGAMIPDKINEGLASQNEFITTTMSDTGKLYIDGLIKGLEENQQRAIDKANEIASQITNTFEEAWDINSPSKVGEYLTKNLIKGLEIGMDGSTLLSKSANMANDIVDSVYSNLYENNHVTNNYNDRSLTTNVNVTSSGGDDKYEIERMWRKLVRKQAAAIAR